MPGLTDGPGRPPRPTPLNRPPPGKCCGWEWKATGRAWAGVFHHRPVASPSQPLKRVTELRPTTACRGRRSRFAAPRSPYWGASATGRAGGTEPEDNRGGRWTTGGRGRNGGTGGPTATRASASASPSTRSSRLLVVGRRRGRGGRDGECANRRRAPTVEVGLLGCARLSPGGRGGGDVYWKETTRGDRRACGLWESPGAPPLKAGLLPLPWAAARVFSGEEGTPSQDSPGLDPSRHPWPFDIGPAVRGARGRRRPARGPAGGAAASRLWAIVQGRGARPNLSGRAHQPRASGLRRRALGAPRGKPQRSSPATP